MNRKIHSFQSLPVPFEQCIKYPLFKKNKGNVLVKFNLEKINVYYSINVRDVFLRNSLSEIMISYLIINNLMMNVEFSFVSCSAMNFDDNYCIGIIILNYYVATYMIAIENNL